MSTARLRCRACDLESGKATVETSKFMDVFQALGFEIAIRNSETGLVRW
ncbi:hypothetical protein [Arthrobacter sp. StoSoilA2]|nr:hypothetical protein [Arthrobacter sp. StoSoilA2]